MLLSTYHAQAVLVSWTNNAGGNWSTGSNWSNGTGPGTNDTARIILNGTYTVTLDADPTIRHLIIGGNTGRQTLSITSHALTTTHGVLVNDKGIINATASTFIGNDALVNNGKIEMSYSTTFNIPLTNNDTIDINSYNNYINQNLICNLGSIIRLLGNHYTTNVTVANGFTNNGTIQFNSILGYTCDLYVTNGQLINAGNGNIVSNSNNAATCALKCSLTNNGTIYCTNNLYINQSSTSFINSGSIDIAPGKFLKLTNITFTHNSGNITGNGTVEAEYSTLNLNAANIPGSRWSFIGCVLNSTQPTLTNNKPLKFQSSNTINANVFNSDSIYIAGYNNNFVGTFTTSAASRILIDGSVTTAYVTYTNGFTNNGIIELNSLYGYACDLYITNDTLVNAAGSTIRNAGIYAPSYSINGNVKNAGTILLNHSMWFNGTSKTLLNTGTINILTSKILTVQNGTFTYNGGSMPGNGEMKFESAVANFNTATIPGKYMWFQYSTINSSQAVVNLNKAIRIGYFNTVNANVHLSDTIYISHYSNTFSGNLTTTGAARLYFDALHSTGRLTFANGFTNNGQIIFNSSVGYGAQLTINNGTLTNAAGSTIKATGIYNPVFYIYGNIVNNGTILCEQNLSIGSTGHTFTNNNIINIAAGKILDNTANTFTYASGTTPGTGTFTFNSATANFNVANMPGKYFEFNNSILNSTFLPITNGRKIKLKASNTINAAVFNTDTILISSYANRMNGALTTAGSSRIIYDCSIYTGALTVSKGFTNNGKILFESTTGYTGYLTLDSNLIINAAGGEIRSDGLSGLNYIYAGVQNAGSINAIQNLHIEKVDSSTNTGSINISANKYLKFYTGKLKYNSGSISGPGKLVFEYSEYEVNQNNIPTLFTEFSASKLSSNLSLINNNAILQFYYNNTISANLKNKVTGTLKFSHYNNLVNGNFTNEANSLISIDGANYHSDVTFLNGFTNLGLIDLRSVTGYNSTLSVTNGELYNNNTGVIHAYEPYGMRYLNAQLNNKSDLSVDRDLIINKPGADHKNVNGGDITIAANATLDIQNATFNYNGGSITGAGFLQFTTSNYILALANFPAVYHKFFTTNVSSALQLNNATTLHFYYNDSLNADVLNKNGGVMRFSHYNNKITGQITTQPNSLISIDAGSYIGEAVFNNGFINKGTLELKSISGYQSNLTVLGSGLVNDTNALFSIPTNYSTTRSYTGLLLNHGTLDISNTAYTYVNSNSFVNSTAGLITGVGNLYFNSGYLLNHGEISPGASPGIFTSTNGNIALSSTSKLKIEIGGPTAGTHHDQLACNVVDSLNGNLNVSLINGYVPVLGDSFIVCTYASRIGSFANVNGTIPGGLAWNMFYRPTYAVIRAGNPSNLNITATAGPNGAISPSGVINIVYNGSQTFNMTPNANYFIDSVFVDGNYIGTPSTYTFNNVTVNHTIHVQFKTNSYTINASKVGAGVISPSGTINVMQGGSQSFSFTPNNTCTKIDSVIVNGIFIGTPASYTFNNVASNHTIKVVFSKAQILTSASNVAVCVGDSTQVSAVSGFTGYLWSNGKTTQSIYIKNAGAYTVTVTGSGGCTATASLTLTVNSLPNVSFTNPYQGNGNRACINDGGVLLNNSGTPGGGYFTGPGVTYGFGLYYFSPGLAGLGLHTLTYTFTDVNGCSSSATQNVRVDTAATVSAGNDLVKCGNLSVQLSGTIGGSATSATWSTNGTGTFNNTNSLNAVYTLSNADANNGTVTLTLTTNNPAGNCDAVSDQVIINYYQNAVAYAGSSNPVCVSSPFQLSGSITGYPLATALWTTTGTGTFNNPNSLAPIYTASVADINAGNIKLCLTPVDPNGSCTFSGDTIHVYFDKYTVNAGNDVVLCGTNVASLSGSKTGAGSSVTWTTNGTGTFNNVNSLTPNYTLSAADKAQGFVTLIITTNDPAGPCGAKSDAVSVYYREAVADAGPTELCGDTIWTVYGSVATSIYTPIAVQWTSSGTGTFNSPNSYGATYYASAADKAAGSVTLKLTPSDPTGLCNNYVSDSIKIWFNPHYTVNAGPDSLFYCGDKQVQLAGTRTSPTSVWSTSGTGTFNNPANLNAKYNFSTADTIAGKVVLRLQSNDPAGPCGRVMDSVIVIIREVPHATAGTNSPVCLGTNLNITASGAGNYSWSGPSGYSSTIQNIIRPNATLAMAGNYTVVVTNSFGCSSTATTTATIISCGCIQPIVLTGKTDATCKGASNGTAATTINNVAGPFTYLWSHGATTQNVTGLSAGVYTVTVSSAPNCSATASVTINEPDNIVITPNIINATCGNANGSAQAVVTGGTPGFTYAWNTVPAQFSSVISSMLPGTYTVTVTDANGFTKSQSATIVNNGSAITEVTVQIKRPCFDDNNGKLTAKTITGGTAPFTYLWSTGAVTSSINQLTPGNYTVTVTDANGCNFIQSTTLIQRSEIIDHEQITNPSCGACNGSIVVIPSGGKGPYTYLWNTAPASINDTVTNLCAGVYTVTITDTLKCKQTFTYTLLDGSPVITVDSITTVKCFGNTTGAIRITASNGTPPYTYLWSNGKTTRNNVNVLAGTYTVTVTDAGGCTSTISATISQPTQLTVTMSKTANTVTANQAGGVAPYTFIWSNGKTSKTIGGLTIGTTYTATVTDANGCTVSGSILFTGNRLGDNVTSFTANLYPNPTQDVVTLSLFNCPLKHATIEIKNMMGAVVLKQKLLVHNENQSILIETINFDQGVYDVSILIDDKILNQRLIIQR